MSEVNDDNFEELRRLLKVKQHEVPPPGYFNRFSGEVITRIRAGETGSGQGIFQGFEDSWLSGLLRIFQARPSVVGGFATSLCLLLLLGVVMADRDGVATNPVLPGISSAPDNSPELAATVPLLPAENSGITISSNSIHGLPLMAGPFGQPQNPLFQPVSFMPAGH